MALFPSKGTMGRSSAVNNNQGQVSAQTTPSSNTAVLVTAPRWSEVPSPHLNGRHSSTGSSLIHVHGEKCETVTWDASTATESADSQNSSNHPLSRFWEISKGFGKKQSNKTDSERELQEWRRPRAVSPARHPKDQTAHRQSSVANDFDRCLEYNYDVYPDQENEDDADDEDPYTRHVLESSASFSRSQLQLTTPASTHSPPPSLSDLTYVLGKCYHSARDVAARRADESSLFWFTYRCDFEPLAPYGGTIGSTSPHMTAPPPNNVNHSTPLQGLTSDAGWGCMLRSAQMLLAQTLRMHMTQDRSWQPTLLSGTQRRSHPVVRSILTWFADFPAAGGIPGSKHNTRPVDSSRCCCWYSLHNMVAAGMQYDKLPGEWYGPGTACYVLRDLVQLHASQEALSSSSIPLFRVHVAAQGTVYRHELENLLVGNPSRAGGEDKESSGVKTPELAHPLDMSWQDEKVDHRNTMNDDDWVRAGSQQRLTPWDCPLLLLIPLRLGLDSFNAEYVQALAFTFSLPQSVGVLGGRPRGARWFFGAHADGSNIVGLDPHTVQKAPRKRSVKMPNGQVQQTIDLSDDYIRSIHTTYAEIYALHKMDPSIALGFYCKDRTDFEDMLAQFRKWKRNHPARPELFSVADAPPDYSAHLSANLMLSSSMIGSAIEGDEDDQIGGRVADGDLSDDDDYVML